MKTFRLHNLLLIILDELDGDAPIAHEVLSVTVAAVSDSVRLYHLLGFLDWHRLHLCLRAADLGPAPFLDSRLDKLLLHDPNDLFSHFIALANVWSR